ncbi:MAG: M35 family metallo-endopeptidase [Xanthobacteraceae bacterium]
MLRRAPASPADVTASAPPAAADPQTVTTALPGQPYAQPADDPFCLNTRPGQGPERCEFTAKQQQTVGFERYAAASLTSQALTNLSRGDPYMTTLAQQVFHAANPDMNQIRTTTSQILDNLRSKPVVCGTCADEDCYTAGVVAHVTDDLSTIVLCQRFFQTSIGEMRRTLVHEAGHAAGVGSGGTGPDEVYCTEGSTGCVDPCSNLSGDLTQNVDAWARFIECAAHSG